MPEAYFKTNVTVYYLHRLLMPFSGIYFLIIKTNLINTKRLKSTSIAEYFRYTTSTRPYATYKG